MYFTVVIRIRTWESHRRVSDRASIECRVYDISHHTIWRRRCYEHRRFIYSRAPMEGRVSGHAPRAVFTCKLGTVQPVVTRGYWSASPHSQPLINLTTLAYSLRFQTYSLLQVNDSLSIRLHVTNYNVYRIIASPRYWLLDQVSFHKYNHSAHAHMMSIVVGNN